MHVNTAKCDSLPQKLIWTYIYGLIRKGANAMIQVTAEEAD